MSNPDIGVLLCNLGTPAAPTTDAVREYLAEFLMDPRVVALPRPLWWLILHGIILRVRPKKSAEAYQQIWLEQGSPLLVNTQRQAQALAQVLPEKMPVAIGMRYGKPSIRHGIKQLQQAGAKRFVVLPLYPQYSTATTASTFDKIKAYPQTLAAKCINNYADHPAYIDALADSVHQHWQAHPRTDKLLMSFHGLPQRQIDKGDPYQEQCHTTAKLLAKALGLTNDEWLITFQSRFGKATWIQPYTDKTLEKLAATGCSVSVICPGFAADCLETLEEINLRYREVFLEAGGDYFDYIPALNDSEKHIQLLKTLIESYCDNW